MMLLLTVFYNIPEFDISHFFLMSCSSGKLNGVGNMTALNNSSAAEHPQIVTNESADPERMRLQPSGSQGPKYTQQINETNELGVRILLFRAFFLEKYSFFIYANFRIPALLLEPVLGLMTTLLMKRLPPRDLRVGQGCVESCQKIRHQKSDKCVRVNR